MNGPGGASVTELFRALGPGLRLYARQWVGASAADDVVQEVFICLLLSSTSPVEPRTWLYRCVRNAAIGAARSTRRRGRREQAVATDASAWFIARPEDRIDAHAAQEAMSKLPSVQREIVTLRIWSGLTLAEIRDVTALPTSTIHDQLRAALATLRDQLEQSCRKTNPSSQMKSK
jgi:RNA polymerase sigma-70 factor (ECF subfamily)